MAKLVSKKTTATVTEEVELVPTTPGEMKSHLSFLVPPIPTVNHS